MLRRVAHRRLGGGDSGLRTSDSGLPRKRHAAFSTKPGPRLVFKSTARTAILEWNATLVTEFHPFGICETAAWAMHPRLPLKPSKNLLYSFSPECSKMQEKLPAPRERRASHVRADYF